MRVFVVVNRIDEIGFRQTTTLLIAALLRENYEVFLMNVEAMSILAFDEPPTFSTQAFRVPPFPQCRSKQVESFVRSDPAVSNQQIVRGDLILIRTNPGRDNSRSQIHETFLHHCILAQSVGIRVVNSPDHLRFFASKSSLLMMEPRYRPEMVVTGDHQQVIDFVLNSASDCVVKPLFGSRGENVIRVSKSSIDLEEMIFETFGTTTLVVQEFVAAEYLGDKRVVVVGGEILESGGHFAGIERRPAETDFRANLHAGGSAHKLSLSDGAVAATQHAARLLYEHGIWLAGIDLIEDKIIEFNVFSTGGLFDSINFSGVPFDELIVKRLFS